MTFNRMMCVIVTATGLALAPSLALAQNAPATSTHVPVLKTIGKPSMAKEFIQSLIVMNSRGATLQGDKLTLSGLTGNSIIFSDRPVRLAGHELTSQLIEEWNSGHSFAKDPPNHHRYNSKGEWLRNGVVRQGPQHALFPVEPSRTASESKAWWPPRVGELAPHQLDAR